MRSYLSHCCAPAALLLLLNSPAAAEPERYGFMDVGMQFGPTYDLEESTNGVLPDGASLGVNALFQPLSELKLGVFFEVTRIENTLKQRDGGDSIDEFRFDKEPDVVDANAWLLQHFFGVQARIAPLELAEGVTPYLNVQLGRVEVRTEHRGSQCAPYHPSWAAQAGLGAEVRMRTRWAVGFGVDGGVLADRGLGCNLQLDPNEILPQTWPIMLHARLGTSYSF